MSLTVLLTIEADNDLSEIFDYTETEFGFNQAVIYLKELDTCFNRLAKHPNLGTHRPELKTDIFCLPQKNHLIFYYNSPTHLTIVRVLHASRDLQRFL